MKILFVNISVPDPEVGTNQWKYVINGLEDLGHDVTLAVPDGDPFYFDKDKSETYYRIRKKLLASCGKIIKIDNMKILPFHCKSSRFGFYCPTAPKIARKIIKGYDIIYILNWYYHLAFVFSKVCHETHIPFIVAGMGALQDKARSLKKSRKKILDFLYTKKMLSNMSGLHSVGNLETEEYIKMGAMPKKIFRIDHGIVPESFVKKDRSGILERIGITKDDIYIITLSRLDPKKGLEVLIKGFNKVRHDFLKLKLVIVGTGSTDYLNYLKKLVSELNLNENIVFSGYVTDEEKIELLESAKMFVGMSHSDVHPLAVVEALAMGLPVVITKTSDFPEIDEYNAGITVDNDPDSMCMAVEKLLKNSDLRTISNNSKRLINEKFLVKHKIKEYELMFSTVINNKK